MINRILFLIIPILLVASIFNHAFAQPAWTIDLLDKQKKPEKFEERKLGSEKMAEKKFTWFRRFVQNNFTHYNYYYNANNKINAVLERAKAAQKDDYTKLLAYYPFSFENTANQKTELDSVIYKATAGILLHDLRNDWIDNMYLLMGKAYFLRKDFDTAAATFQFINYNLFPRKKDEDDSRVVGTTEAASKSRISIANDEKQNIIQKVTGLPPSRNDALIWLTRTLIEQDELGEAAGIIHTLQNDPNLPKRLQNDLDDINAYWFYKQNIYDSAAVYLEKGLSNADNKQDKGRSEFLLAQLYEITKQYEKASDFYNTASIHTTNPLLDIHAQLNNAKMRKGNNSKELDRGIDNLIDLTKKDKFETYRDILYYFAGDLAMLKPDTTQAVTLFTKSYQLNANNVVYKNKAFLQLADIAYNRKQYKIAYNFYDSLQSGDTTLKADLAKIQNRRNALSKIVEKIYILEREDSLQMVAAMLPAAREAFVKKLAKKLRKEKGLKEDDNSSGNTDPLISFDKDKNTPVDLFSNNNKTGEWYFYNANLKAKGFSDFKKKWGVRTNADNWRRKSAAALPVTSRNPDNISPMGNMNPDDIDSKPLPEDSKKEKSKDDFKGKDNNQSANKSSSDVGDPAQPEDISYEGLMSNLPLTPELIKKSNTQIAENLFELGKLFKNELEDYQEAVASFEKSLQRFPDSLYDGELYFNLFYCYNKLGLTDKANFYKNLLNNNFAESHSAKLLNNPAAAKPSEKNIAGTKRYEAIYNLFIEGKFEEALSEKKNADSLFGNNFWSPQLLYIEAVYHVKQKNDSAAIIVLQNIGTLYPTSPLKPKADRLVEVLGRRKEIEKYLTDLEITRLKEDEKVKIEEQRKAMVRNDSTLIQSPKFSDSTKAIGNGTDTAALKKDTPVTPVVSGPYTFNATAAHKVVMLLDKVDVTYIGEAKNALARYASDNFRAAQLTVSRDTIDNNYALIIFSQFATADEALQFLYKVKKAAPDEVSWLPANKFSFLIIDDANLQRLKNTKDVTGYKNLLNIQYPGLIK